MSVKIYDAASQAFVEPQNVPRRYDTESGAWADTTGKAYSQTDAAWTERWSQNNMLYLYNEGDECTDVTGGWTVGWTYTIGGHYSYRKETDHLYLNAGGDQVQVAVSFTTKNFIDVSKYSKLCVEASTSVLSNTGLGFGLYVGNPANTWLEISDISSGATAYGLVKLHYNKQYKLNNEILTKEKYTYTHEFALGGIQRPSISDYGQNAWNIYRVWLE